MSIYLPIAEMSVNIFVLFGMGAAVGFLSGMFGVGGGFLLVPGMHVVLGVPIPYAVGAALCQTVATASAVLAPAS